MKDKDQSSPPTLPLSVAQQPDSLTSGPELFFGLVVPLGSPGGTLAWALQQALLEVNYTSKPIKVIGELQRIQYKNEVPDDPFRDLSSYADEYSRYIKSIKAGNEFCHLMGGIDDHDGSSGKGQDALIALCINKILEIRNEHWAKHSEEQGDPNAPQGAKEPDAYFSPLRRTAFILRSLKRLGEISRCRSIYGNGFFVIAAHSPRDSRVDNLARKLLSSEHGFDQDLTRDRAEELLRIDKEERGTRSGQNVGLAYATADLFVDAGQPPSKIVEQISRFIDALFNYQFYTPTLDEQGMAIAHLASLRSAHLSRQVGAAITTSDGSVVAIGCNEVPKAFGGAYWPFDARDKRDFQLRKNTSLLVRGEILSDTLTRLAKAGMLAPEAAKRLEKGEDRERLLQELRENSDLMAARVMDALEYDRSVHAEMSAITDAARRGVPISGCTLYTTTFPCHNCARHIVAAGISRVVYIHPFEKSLTKRLHNDAIGIDLDSGTGRELVRFDPFVGISPNLYHQLFTMGLRRASEADRWTRIARWDKRKAQPRLRPEKNVYREGEKLAKDWLQKRLAELGLGLLDQKERS